jgi:ADP-dependent NAD(P)H-hydrate dehydratase / NAD(P)H-hydrate epimerase
VIPVLTAEQMRAADAAALGIADDQEVFIRRAGYSVAVVAKQMMRGTYGRRVTVIVGTGHNGDDGRVAAAWLSQWGAQIRNVDAHDAGEVFIDPRSADLVIDAAYGIGFRGTWSPPIVMDVSVLAVDIPSGLDATLGTIAGGVLVADRTVTFAAVKTGMLCGDGPSACGEIDVVDVGIDPPADLHTFLVESLDIAHWIPVRDRGAHKWHHGVRVVAGSPGMAGAASLVSASAMRAGAGIVHLSWRGDTDSVLPPTEVVGHVLPREQWAKYLAPDIHRFACLVMGPGLGRGDDIGVEVRAVLRECDVATVVDGDGLVAAVDPNGGHSVLLGRTAPTVLTPHDGEFAMLGGDVSNPDRIAATRELAEKTHCVVVRKGPTTIVSNPAGDVLLSASGDERLATAGSGDVLAGVIGACIARGLDPFLAAAAGVHIHGLAGSSCAQEGVIARDVVSVLGEIMSKLVNDVR